MCTNVHVKYPPIAAAIATVSALPGRQLAGKMVTTDYLTLPTCHNLFLDSIAAILLVSRKIHSSLCT
jgi:hypothetical protein